MNGTHADGDDKVGQEGQFGCHVELQILELEGLRLKPFGLCKLVSGPA